MKCINKLPQKNNLGITVHVRCGNCIPCVVTRQNDWLFRMNYEWKTAKNAYFITLTYDEKNMPWIRLDTGEVITQKTTSFASIEEETQLLQTLDYSDLNRFWKSLKRKHLREYKRAKKQNPNIGELAEIKYFTNGEYGENTYRPHYHAIVFNINPDYVKDIWNKGHVKVEPLQREAGLRYVTKYVGKKTPHVPITLKKDEDGNYMTAVLPKHNHAKKLGYGWLETAGPQARKQKMTTYYLPTSPDRPPIKLPLPRYIMERLYTKIERKVIFAKQYKEYLELYTKLLPENIDEIINQFHQSENKSSEQLKEIRNAINTISEMQTKEDEQLRNSVEIKTRRMAQKARSLEVNQ